MALRGPSPFSDCHQVAWPSWPPRYTTFWMRWLVRRDGDRESQEKHFSESCRTESVRGVPAPQQPPQQGQTDRLGHWSCLCSPPATDPVSSAWDSPPDTPIQTHARYPRAQTDSQTDGRTHTHTRIQADRRTHTHVQSRTDGLTHTWIQADRRTLTHTR